MRDRSVMILDKALPIRNPRQGRVFKRVTPSVVVVRTREADAVGQAPGTFTSWRGLGQTFVSGDIILSVGTIQVGEPGSRERILAPRRSLVPGPALTIVVLRDGQPVELTSRVEPTE